jgi:hypothetical protein
MEMEKNKSVPYVAHQRLADDGMKLWDESHFWQILKGLVLAGITVAYIVNNSNDDNFKGLIMMTDGPENSSQKVISPTRTIICWSTVFSIVSVMILHFMFSSHKDWSAVPKFIDNITDFIKEIV